MGNSNDESGTSMKTIDLDFKGISVPCPEYLLAEGSEVELREWIRDNCVDDILSAMIPRKDADHSAYSDDRRLSLLDKISQVQRQYLQTEGPKVVFDTLLSGLLEILQCEYGLIGEVKQEDDGRPYLHTLALTDISWNEETQQLYAENEMSGFKFYNMNTLFGECVKTGKTVISNSPKTDPRAGGIPPGHPAMNSFLGFPLYDRGGTKMSGMVGLANKPGGFTKEDIAYLEPFVVTSSNLIQAYNTIRENKELIDKLEEKVAARTFELEVANRRLEETNRKMLEASKMQLEHFACMSHEIRTPLNCIVGLSSLLHESKLEPFQEDAVQMIATSSELLQAVVNDVLDYSKLESGHVTAEISKTNLQETLDAVVHSIECKGRDKHVRVKTHYGPSVPEFYDTDCRRLQQILYNLLGNAVKFSDEGGVVDFTVDVVQQCSACPRSPRSTASVKENSSNPPGCPFKAKHCRAPQACPAEAGKHQPPHPLSQMEDDAKGTYMLRFSVKDYGIGIAEEDFESIFMPFRQARGDTEKVFGGTGLGLAITSKLVNALGGTITVNSRIGEWSEFTVDLLLHSGLVDTKALSAGLEKAVVLHVSDGTSNFPCSEFLEHFNVDLVQYDSCDDLVKSAEALDESCTEKVYICLVQEDLYDARRFRSLERRAKTVLLTFGPNYAVKEAKGHYRSLDQILPVVLLQSMTAHISRSASFSQVTRSLSDSGDELGVYKKMRVLIAEDNVINQKVLHKMLSKIGLNDVDIAANGQEAVDQSDRVQYDIILMDMQMPVMDGLEACRLIVQRRKSARAPKVVFVTANASDAFESKAIAAGGSGFISKPFNLRQIERFFESL